MTESEWYALLDGTLNADTGAAAVVQLKDAVTASFAEMAQSTATITQLQEENKRLRDTNAQLALRVTSEVLPKDDPPADDNPDTALKDLIKELKGEE